MKTVFFLFITAFITSASAYEVSCQSICEMKEADIKFCMQISDKSVDTSVYYTGAKGDNIEISSYPYTDLNEVVKEMLREVNKNGSTGLAKMLAKDAKDISCDNGGIINFADVPVAAQYFK